MSLHYLQKVDEDYDLGESGPQVRDKIPFQYILSGDIQRYIPQGFASRTSSCAAQR